MKTRFLSLLLLAACPLPLLAQTPPVPEEPKTGEGDTTGNPRFWQATLPGGEYMVALDRISSVSRHKYVLDGALLVDEVTIDTLGQALARFYFISPVTDTVSNGTAKAASEAADRAKELLDSAADRAGSSAQDMVIKKYPETTHARTVEYRILSEKQLTALFDSAKKAWESGKGRKMTVK